MHRLIHELESSPPKSTVSYSYRRKALRQAYAAPLDRVNELGNDADYGHTGCVNALSWALNGDVLISGGDDRTVRLWRQDPNDFSTPYPYKEAAIVQTGHTANIFNAHLLPSSSRIATVAGDGQVRVLDCERALTSTSHGKSPEFSERETCIRVLKCHTGRTKRIVTEESSDVFLTVAEVGLIMNTKEGAVRQHDLRTPHQCDRGRSNCPPALVTLPLELSTLASSPLAPYLFVVAGESPYGYLFDRRQVGRILRAEWGRPCNEEEYVTCVRRFGRPTGIGDSEGYSIDHITGARMAQTNGHELLLTYSADAVYLYSIRDEPDEGHARSSSVLSSNDNAKTEESSLKMEETNVIPKSWTDGRVSGLSSHSTLDTGSSFSAQNVDVGSDEDVNEEEQEEELRDDDDDEVFSAASELDEKFKEPIIMPRRRFIGHCNVETVKDVNFAGAEDELVASGSDDGNFFLWKKDTGQVHGIYEGDQAVVNVIESHPRIPLIACSGIDTTVKLFAPRENRGPFSRTHNSESIMCRNMAQSRTSARAQVSGFARRLWHYRLALRRHNADEI